MLSEKLSILMYHRVLKEPDPLRPGDCTITDFEKQMQVLAAYFNVLSLHAAAERLAEKKLPPRTVCITFDDGYRDNWEIALPILRKYGLRATIFIASGYLNGGIMWNDAVIECLRVLPAGETDLSDLGAGRYELGPVQNRKSVVEAVLGALKYLPPLERQRRVDRLMERAGLDYDRNLMLKSEHVLDLVGAGMHIGAHTVTHPILSKIDDDAAHREIVTSKRDLEDITDREVRLFAYPNGKPGADYAARHVEMVRQSGFSAAVSTVSGAASAGSDMFELPRFGPWPESKIRFLARCLMLHFA